MCVCQVLGAFGMDTYRDPLSSSLVLHHLISLLAVGTALFALNLAIEYGCFDALLTRYIILIGFYLEDLSVHASAPHDKEGNIDDSVSRFAPRYTRPRSDESLEEDVLREERRVTAAVSPLRLRTIGNINAGKIKIKLFLYCVK